MDAAATLAVRRPVARLREREALCHSLRRGRWGRKPAGAQCRMAGLEPPEDPVQLTRPELLDAYRRMRLIRAFELKLAELVTAGKMGGFMHLYAGEEAVAVGVCQ